LATDELAQQLPWCRWPGSAADISRDGSIDVVGLLYLVKSFGGLMGDPDYYISSNLNSDGSVDVVDLLILVDWWGIWHYVSCITERTRTFSSRESDPAVRRQRSDGLCANRGDHPDGHHRTIDDPVP
jgi:hypothetical protein